ncbi:MAG: hypothetical protein ACOX5T_07445 [Candidatus Cryptobacteroides sp.]|jgi:hypothetical protein
MNRIISIFVFVVMIVFSSACKRTTQKDENQTDTVEVAINYLSVDDVFLQGDSLANKTVYVEGIVEHVCKHSHKRFKIIGKNENLFIRIELGDDFQTVDPSIIGDKAKVTGKLIPIIMDEQAVMQWETKMKQNHKGEENTDHYKEELAFIQDTYQQIISGEIPYYTNYSIRAESYELE